MKWIPDAFEPDEYTPWLELTGIACFIGVLIVANVILWGYLLGWIPR